MRYSWKQFSELGEGGRRSTNKSMPQEAWLFDCLRRNRAAHYGLRYGFDRIRTVGDYRRSVPIVSYEDVAPWIGRMASGEADVLFVGLPLAFECTGGSTGGKKLIPYSEASLQDFRSAILPWLADAVARYRLSAGSAYWAISPATRPLAQLPSNIRVGMSDGEYLGSAAASAVADLSAVPLWVGSISHVPDWQIMTLYWLVRRDDLELISVWSPTFFSTLLDALEQRVDELTAILRDGGTVGGHEVPPDLAAYHRLSEYLVSLHSRALWPHLKLVSCWADASSTSFFDALKARLPHAAFQGKGLLSTEGVVTAPDRDGRPVLAVNSGFFEFEDGDGCVWCANQLADRERYEVIMTTSGGLYRYRTGDCVVCEGQVDGVPILRFTGRRGLVSDMVGEKLTEEFVARCMADIPGFRMLMPYKNPKPAYALVVDRCTNINSEQLANCIEKRLSGNPQYAYARDMGQLSRLSVHRVARPLEAYLDRAVKGGSRLGDVKLPSLCREADWLDTFMEVSA
jgi:hypothetical protein